MQVKFRHQKGVAGMIGSQEGDENEGLTRSLLGVVQSDVVCFELGHGFLARSSWKLSPAQPFANASHASTAATLRTANENITRVTPLIIMLTPTRVPIAQTELEGHCR